MPRTCWASPSQAFPGPRPTREQLEWLASISDRHRDELRRLQSAEAEARHQRELLAWLAQISPRHERQLHGLLSEEAEAREAQERCKWLVESSNVQEAQWDPSRHPRGAFPQNRGWWSPTGGSGGASSKPDRPGGSSEPKETGEHGVTSAMLGLAHAWWQTNRLLQQNRRDIEELPARIASEQAKFASRDGHSNVHAQNLAKAQRDLQHAKALLPQLEAQLRDLEQQYHDSGYDDVPYSTWTPGETIVGGRGIEEVGYAVHVGGSPAGLKPTGIEFDIVSAALAGPAILRLGKAVLNRALAKTVATVPKLAEFIPAGKTTGVMRTASGDIPLISGRAGPAASLPKGTPGFNAISKTHVEGHAAAIMRQQGIRETTIYINNPKICLPCEQNLTHMLPKGSKLTVVLPDGTRRIFIGNAR